MAINAEQVVEALESEPAWAVLGLGVRSERLRNDARDGLARFLVERLNGPPARGPGAARPSALMRLAPTSTAPILNAASATKAVATMASTTSLPPNEPAVVDMAAFGRDLVRRRAAAGEPVPPRNAGNRRTPSKKALLAAIEEAGGRW